MNAAGHPNVQKQWEDLSENSELLLASLIEIQQ